jgi:hypothetical protein
MLNGDKKDILGSFLVDGNKIWQKKMRPNALMRPQ